MADIPLVPLTSSWRAWWDGETHRDIGGGPIARIGQIIRRRAVVRELVVRELKSSYGSSFLGYAWTLFTPLSLIAVYTLVFAHVVNLNLKHYPLFVAAGMMPWVFFNSTVMSSMTSLKSNSGIIRTINMPREIFPLVAVGEAFVEYLLSLPVVFILGFFYGVFPSKYVVFLPVSAFIQASLLVGLALLLSALNTIVRDVQRVVRPMMRVLFYLTPTAYPVSRVQGGFLTTIYKLDPLVGIIDLNRLTWYPHYLIPPATIFGQATISAGLSVVFLVLGWIMFTRLEPAALKEL